MKDKLNKLVEDHIKDAEDFKALVERVESSERLRPLNKLLTCEPMVVYYLFNGMYRANSLRSIYSLYTSLIHAFEDDGEYQLNKVVDEVATSARKHINEFFISIDKELLVKDEVVYKYVLESDHSYSKQPIRLEELSEILDVMQKPYDYYDVNKLPIEEDRTSIEYSEWRRLTEESDAFLEALYKKKGGV